MSGHTDQHERWEGLPLMEKLLEAARDPVKGYQSKYFPVKISSAYRLTRA